jgi:transmembrane sensor
LLDDDLDASAFADAAAVPEVHAETAAPRRRFGLAFAIAAAFALVAFLWQPWAQPPSSGYQIATAQGEHRSFQLADGSSIALNGNSRLWVASADGREAELLRGEALFAIRHNPQRPFVLRLGDDRVEDLGTTFNVVRDRQILKVEVAEGAVRYHRGGNRLQLRAGQTLDILPTGDAAVGRKRPSAIATWRAGQLVYEAVPVAEVARELGRNLGVTVSVAPGFALQPFTGSVHVAGPAKVVVPQFASAIGARARKSGGEWLIE